jgi:small conductance mechanosensitive channel
VKEIILGFLKEDNRIISKNPIVVGLNQITEQGMQVKVRAWVKTADYSQVYFDVNASAAISFSKGNIQFAKS